MRYFVADYNERVYSRHNDIESAMKALFRKIRNKRGSRSLSCASIFAVENGLWHFVPIVVFDDFRTWQLGLWTRSTPDKIKRRVQEDFFVFKFVKDLKNEQSDNVSS